MPHQIPQEVRKRIIWLVTDTVLSYAEIARRVAVSQWTVCKVVRLANIRRGRGPLSPSHPMFKEKETPDELRP